MKSAAACCWQRCGVRQQAPHRARCVPPCMGGGGWVGGWVLGGGEELPPEQHPAIEVTPAH